MGGHWSRNKRPYALPDTKRATFFHDSLMIGWGELLCCPIAMGCHVVHFQESDPRGGTELYSVMARMSNSEFVPRYEVHAVRDGKFTPCVVGHMERTETHVRVKPGEFLSVAVWKLISNGIELQDDGIGSRTRCMQGGHLKPLPSSTDVSAITMTIATQAKLNPVKDQVEGAPQRYDKNSERWIQTVGVDNENYRVLVESAGKGRISKMKLLNVLRILNNEQKVCVCRKQQFAGALGKTCQPFLGVQMGPSHVRAQTPGNEEDEEKTTVDSYLDTPGIMLLLLALAWSEETMQSSRDNGRYVQAMRYGPGLPGSAEQLGLSVTWDTGTVEESLWHVPGARVHHWRGEDLAAMEDEDEEEHDDDDDDDGDDDDEGDEDDVMATARSSVGG